MSIEDWEAHLDRADEDRKASQERGERNPLLPDNSVPQPEAQPDDFSDDALDTSAWKTTSPDSGEMEIVLDGSFRPRTAVELLGEEPLTEQERNHLPYPWCVGNPTQRECIRAGYCRRNPSCGD